MHIYILLRWCCDKCRLIYTTAYLRGEWFNQGISHCVYFILINCTLTMPGVPVIVSILITAHFHCHRYYYYYYHTTYYYYYMNANLSRRKP